jgi:4'-phosphopantetheinyl transferase
MKTDRLWPSPPDLLILPSDELHLWRISVDYVAPNLASLEQLLSKDERARADRFRFSRNREQYIIRRAAMRQILARYVGVEPQQLRFSYGAYGKPSLAGPVDGQDIRFNISHSEDLALCGVTRGRDIGVDIEHIRTDLDISGMTDRCLTSRERETLEQLPMSIRKHAFFVAWSRKEAYVKARGQGLGYPLHRFEVSLCPGEPSVLLSDPEDPLEVLRWRLEDVPADQAYAAAAAVEGRSWMRKLWRWDSVGDRE